MSFLILGIDRGTNAISDPPIGVFLDPPLGFKHNSDEVAKV